MEFKKERAGDVGTSGQKKREIREIVLHHLMAVFSVSFCTRLYCVVCLVAEIQESIHLRCVCGESEA